MMTRSFRRFTLSLVSLCLIFSQYKVTGSDQTTKTIRLITYNVQDKDPDNVDVSDLLQLKGNATADIVAIGLQEVPSLKTDYLVQVSYDDWSRAISRAFREADYHEVGRHRIAGIVLNVYAKIDTSTALQFTETASRRRGFGGFLSNKGAVGVSFYYRGTSVTIVNCHLTPHLEKYKERVKDYDSISNKLNFVKRDLADHDLVFWMGDLNFRIDNMAANEVVDRTLNFNEAAISELLANDQLTKGRNSGEIFNGYTEMTPRFRPTYKFYAGTDQYDQYRVPAWTDRILFRSKQYGALQVDQRSYDAHEKFRFSDHKPVSAEYVVHFPVA
ncbi:Phosphatidylinositol 4,5-bisphosphate 5-phosphatase A [Halotydeus destructor]|nr:Phosphatidylinositol 4,5-bisphosphate 5-phosphatase A [Halotydeus destructor]